MDRPAATLCVLLDLLVREHCQHKLTLDLRQRFEQLGEILLVECSVVVSAVRSDIGRINEVKRLLAVVAFDKVCAILTFDCHMVEPAAEFLGKGILGVAQLLCCCSRAVIAESAVKHRCEAELRAYPHCPGTLYGSEELRVRVDMLGVGVYLAAVERGIDKLFEGGILALRHLVEVDEFGVDVVDDLTFCRLLGK